MGSMPPCRNELRIIRQEQYTLNLGEWFLMEGLFKGHPLICVDSDDPSWHAIAYVLRSFICDCGCDKYMLQVKKNVFTARNESEFVHVGGKLWCKYQTGVCMFVEASTNRVCYMS